ncbi:mitochondrial fission ELM1 family protein [Dokdonella sp.]|uniref:mitochondrial fission ELM1 family protein n=1 Tax=Dokdonella sp. TaxID=2291710 RepID=UPI003529B455
MSPDASKSTCWVISDGAAGNERQARALAGALGLEPRVLQLRLSQPWNWLSPHLTLGAQSAMRDEGGSPIEAPWPDIAIGCGRKAALLTRCLRRWSAGRCFTVQILDPRTDPRHFDLVVTPKHDRLVGKNVIETLGALNPVDDEWLSRGRESFRHLGAFPSPRIGVLIGASTGAVRLDDDYFRSLVSMLGEQHARHGGSFLVSTSRRTPPLMASRLRTEFSRWPGLFWGGPQDGENPYAGILAWSDRIVVTPDSVNMISEACATGKPVCAFGSERVTGKLRMFQSQLGSAGFLVGSLSGDTVQALRETPEVAALVGKRMRTRT